MDIDKLSSTEQLRPDQRELADIIGLEAYKKLIHHYGGNQLYIFEAMASERPELFKEVKKFLKEKAKAG